MDAVFNDFRTAYEAGNGYDLSQTFSPISPASDPDRLDRFYRSTNFQHVQKDFKNRIMSNHASPFTLPAEEGNGWVDVYHAYWKAVGEILKAEAAAEMSSKVSWVKVYESWRDMTIALIRGYTNCGFEAWTVPCLYVAGKYIRIFAIKADEGAASTLGSVTNFDDFNPEAEKNEKLEDAARHLNRIFTICLSDRAPLEESRKWGIYNIINLLFKTYFKLNSVSLSKNILKAIQAYRGDMPTLDAFPLAHQVTFKYYVGVIYFLEEAYEEAEKHLTEAWQMCHKDSIRNKELILTYLIPCHLLTAHTLPSSALLEPYPRLQALFLPLSRCIKNGDLAGFDAALVAGEDEFTKRRIYLTLERGRDIALRNLLRKVFIFGGFEENSKDPAAPPVRKTRIPVSDFGAAISLGSKETMENDEVECLLSTMIYKNLMKGYIARERGIVVLSKGGAFPGTGV
ncbi:COP9 signalosome (CSN) subunit [Cadophora gregata]|uniref:COP9 signalosome (CSN) subunit n=1 Tax=Cadophora gregata TaxID=51156 RepID=UPI0026DC1117|nr:COP9 signalosome (CSN) subunit [Cadophora gregata]KAK0124062.1 COP9 signalosome (CSN) subunit [Cadophora gregata]